MARDMKRWIRNICDSDERKIMPLATYPGVEITGQKVVDMVRSGRSQFKCIKAMSERFPSAAAVMIMDLSVEAEAFGSPVEFSYGDIPTVTASIAGDRKSVDELPVPWVGAKRTGEYIEAVRLASSYISDRPLFGGMIGPYSLAGRLFDISATMIAVMLEPQTVHALLGKCASFLTGYAQAFKEAGADGIIVAEPAAGLLSPGQCQEFSSDYLKQVVDAVQDDGFVVVLHNCGNTERLVPSMLSTGSAGLHFGNAVDMKRILPQVPPDRVAFGNINPVDVIKDGTVESIREETLQLLHKTAGFKNFVLSSGCDVPLGTPIKNIQALYDAVDEFNKRDKSQN